MEIKFFGHSCFRLRGKQTVLVTDPFEPKNVGLKLPKISADIITISHQPADHNNAAAISGTGQRPEPFVVSGPGEYEISGVSIFGISSGENTIYIINIDDLRLVHLGDLGHKLIDSQLEEINGCDVLFIPVGAVEVIAQVEPKIVIPMHYFLPGLAFKLDPVQKFLKQIGVETKAIDKLIINKEKLPEERQVVVLNARS